MTKETNTEAEAIASLALKGRDPIIPEMGDEAAPLAFLPDEDGGWLISDLSVHMPTPRRKAGDVVVSNPESLAAYANKHGDRDSLVITYRDSNNVIITLDHHCGPEGEPGWCEHRCRLGLLLSDEWKAWQNSNGHWMSQRGFAEFLDDQAPDIVAPTAAEVHDVVKSLEVTSNRTFSNDIDLVDGKHHIKISSEQKVRSKVEGVDLPAYIKLLIPVYRDGERYEMIARMRRRVDDDGKLELGYRLSRPEQVQASAFKDVCATVKELLTIDCPFLDN